jgi:hypothetical protein
VISKDQDSSLAYDDLSEMSTHSVQSEGDAQSTFAQGDLSDMSKEFGTSSGSERDAEKASVRSTEANDTKKASIRNTQANDLEETNTSAPANDLYTESIRGSHHEADIERADDSRGKGKTSKEEGKTADPEVALKEKENGQEDKMTLKKTNDAESKTIPAII